jgi:Ca2+/Na+ antiporter
MSQQLYEKMLSLIIGFTIFLALALVSGMLMFLYVIAQIQVCYMLFLIMAASTAVYFFLYYQKAKNLRESLEFLLPNAEKEETIPPLHIDVEDPSLKVCLFYRNGATYEEIKRDLGFKHPNQVKRALIKGLDQLLREHKLKKELEVRS